MKVLFDCIVTSDLRKCSTVAQFHILAELLLDKPNTYIYWPLPERVFLPENIEELESLPKSERILYLSIPQSKDRYKEYNRVRPELEDFVSFNGSCWDWDVLVTVRSTQVPLLKILSGTPKTEAYSWSKRIVLIEDMMILSKKPTVALSCESVQDRLTIEAYLAADLVLIPAYHEKKLAIAIAKLHFSPARVKELPSKLLEVCHLNMPTYQLKNKFKYDGTRKLNVAFVGRMEKTAARLSSINAILSKQFIFNGDKIRPFICTVSTATKGVDTHAIEILHPLRDEFHRIAREEMDLAVYFHVDVELNMSMLEPISFGVPVLVYKADWSVAMLGETYPFFVRSETEAYAYINKFSENYQELYLRFSEWFNTWFIPTYNRRVANDGLYKHLLDFCSEKYPDDCQPLHNLVNNEVVNDLVRLGGKELDIFSVIQGNPKVFRHLQEKTKPNDREGRNLVFSTAWNEFRLALKYHFGFVDASIKVGHLKKE